MIEKIIVIVAIAVAVIGLVWSIRRQRQALCDSSCSDCPLKDSGCTGKFGKSGCSGKSGITGKFGKSGITGLFLLLTLGAQAHVEGIVVDQDGMPLPFANVYWAGTTFGTATDTAGVFEIEPTHQTRTLIASYTGYRSDTVEVLAAGKTYTMVLVNDVELDEIHITERKVAVLRSRVSALNTQTLTGQELCKAACCNLSESFETSASVDVAYADAATGAQQIRLLGLSGTYVQLLTENTPNVRGLAQSFGMSYIPGPWMSSIQVSKGTSSVINGYEAITGQINVEYLKPQTSDPLDLNAMINDQTRTELNATGGWDVNEHVSTGVLAHGEVSGLEMDNNKDGILDDPTVYNGNLLNRWYITAGDYTGQILVRGLYDQRHGGQTRDARAESGMPAYGIDLKTWRIDGFMKNGFVFNEDLGTSIGIITALSYHNQDNWYGDRRWQAAQWNAYLNAIFQTNFENERLDPEDKHEHKLSAGLSVNYDHYDENVAVPMYWESQGQVVQRNDLSRQETTSGLFAEYTYSYLDLLTVLLGVRGDYSNRYGFFATPRLNIRYSPFAWWTLRGSVGLGYRSPNAVADNAGYLPSYRTYSFQSGTLAQEKSLNTGLTTTFYIPMGNREMTLTGEYYYTRFMNGVIVDIDRDKERVWFYNMAAVPGAQSFAHNLQIEANMEILRGWTLTAAFRYTDAQQTTFRTASQALELRAKPLQNRFKGVLTTSYQTPLKKWQFDFTAQFNGPGRMPDGFEVPTGSKQYFEKDGILYHTWFPQLMAQVTKYWRTWSLYLGAENMTNFMQDSPIAGNRVGKKQYVDPWNKNFDASMVWGPVMGWGVYLGFRWGLPRNE